MSEPMRSSDKAELLANIQTGYDQFRALLASLREEQMTIPGVNGSWSVKDNLAHLTVWQSYQAARQEGILDGVEPPDPAPGLETEDEENEYFYQLHKDRPLAEVLADFRASYQRVLAATQALSWEALNKPFPWYDNNVPVVDYTMGNTYGHYELHREMIQRWLESQA
ncbi:MAG TPA: ClbS/DfsB family four-helix bundle protein [Ktedonobacteraceae bacterium]|nr:ClbS/DfsB family four-helix bundle protein [Ktedonobacteraceae bacterium]